MPIKSALKVQLPKATTSMVQDIMALKWAFPNSFHTIGSIRTDPNILTVQQAQWKVPIKYREQIVCTLNDVVKGGHSTCLLTYRVDIFAHPLQAWWYNPYRPQP